MTRREHLHRHELLAAERRRIDLRPHGALRIAVGYPNSYWIAQSSLAYQWVVELTTRADDVGVERFFADPDSTVNLGRSFDTGRPLGDFHIVAFSCSFELDSVHLLRCLAAAGIPLRRERRGAQSPLIVVGGALASINPLPLAPAVDLFCLGAAELIWPQVISTWHASSSRQALLEELAPRDGFFVPSLHLDRKGVPTGRVRRLEKRDAHVKAPGNIPSSSVVTPHTEYSNRGLVEISRGCPEKCRYCWVSHNYGRLRSYPVAGILERIRELAHLSPRVGLVATAVGDHPELSRILSGVRDLGLNVALSSLRIPAMVPEVLEPLADAGARSVTIAPETGSNRLRALLNKPVSNARILEAVEAAQTAGIPNLKMYFIVGLPGEEDADLEAVVELLREASRIVVAHGRRRASVGRLHAGASILIPKPYTPFANERVLGAREAKRRLQLVAGGIRDLPGVRFTPPSYREALWQAYLSRVDGAGFTLLQEALQGEPLARLISRHRRHIDEVCGVRGAGVPPWHFVTSAPRKTPRELPPRGV